MNYPIFCSTYYKLHSIVYISFFISVQFDLIFINKVLIPNV